MVFMLLLLYKWLMLNFPCRTEKIYILHGAECLEGKGNAVQANRKTLFDFSRAE